MKQEIVEALKYLKNNEKDDTSDWSTREKLALASAVIETGQEYWPSISRLIQPFGNSNREKNWGSAKDCAKQYCKLIDTIGKKKRTDNNNSSLSLKEQIVKRLTVERIQELQDLLRKEQSKQNALSNLMSELESGSLDDQVPEIWDNLIDEPEFVDFITKQSKSAVNDNYSETTEAMRIEKRSKHNDENLMEFDNGVIATEKAGKPRLVLHLRKTGDDQMNDADSISSEGTEPAVWEDMSKYSSESLSPDSAWNKKSRLILNNVIDDPNSHLFDSVTLERKDNLYNRLLKSVRNPMEIRTKLRDNRYENPQDFEHDLLLLFLNSLFYFPSQSPSNKIIGNLYEKIFPLFKCLYEDNESEIICDTPKRRITRHR